MRNQLRISHPVALVVVVLVVIAAGYYVYTVTRPSAYKAPTVFTRSPEPSPGAPGNPGDVAKEQQGADATPSPSVSPSPVTSSAPSASSSPSSSISVTGFTVSQQTTGDFRVASYVNGVATGDSCQLTLTSPQHDHNASATGSIAWAGQYYFCQFGTIAGTSESGTWTASLSVHGAGGSLGSATAEFEGN